MIKLLELITELDDFLNREGTDINDCQYEFLNGILLKELCRYVIREGVTNEFLLEIAGDE